MAAPSFFIVGNPKGGTTALYRFLRAHPGVFMCHPKEPKFFATDFTRHEGPGLPYVRRTEAEYRALFDAAQPGQRCGEASTWYLYSREAAANIHAFAPDARIIAMLREPVDFLHSYYLHLRRAPASEGENAPDFETALALEPERRQGRRLPPGCLLPEFLFYSERVRYAEQLGRYLRRFGAARVKVVLYDDFRRDNAAVYRDVLRFLDIDADFRPPFEAHNRGRALRSKPMQRLLHTVTFGEGWAAPLKPVLKRLVPEAPRRHLVQGFKRRFVFAPKQTLAPELVQRLKPRFREEVAALGALLDRDLLTLWGYDTTG